MRDWTTACTRTFTVASTLYTQTLCCPPGAYACDPQGRRACLSTLSTPTVIWVNLATPTGSVLFESLSLSTVATGGPITVYRSPFPLQKLVSGSTSDASFTTVPAASHTASNDSHLSGPQIAGIVVGAVVVFGTMALGVLVYIRKWKRPRPGKGEAAEVHDVSEMETSNNMKTTDIHDMEALPRGVVSELATPANDIELQGTPRKAELGGNRM